MLRVVCGIEAGGERLVTVLDLLCSFVCLVHFVHFALCLRLLASVEYTTSLCGPPAYDWIWAMKDELVEKRKVGA